MIGAQGLRNQFGQHQNRQRHCSGYNENGDYRMRVGPNTRGLIADTNRADGVGDGVEREDCSQRTVNVVLKNLKTMAKSIAFL